MAEDDPTEHLHEEIHEHAHSEHGKGPSWIGVAALTAALLAALAAIGGSLASSKLTESTRAQIASNDKWGEYQANSIKEKILLHSATPLTEEDKADLAKYAGRDEIKKEAVALNADSSHDLETHETLERAVTFFHISIAVVAIAVLTRRKPFFYVSLGTGAIGIYFLVVGLGLHFTGSPHEGHPTDPPGSHAPAEPGAQAGH